MLVFIIGVVYNTYIYFLKRYVMEKKHENKHIDMGLQLNKKTMIALTLVLVTVLAFIGVLTQTLPRG